MLVEKVKVGTFILEKSESEGSDLWVNVDRSEGNNIPHFLSTSVDIFFCGLFND